MFHKIPVLSRGGGAFAGIGLVSLLLLLLAPAAQAQSSCTALSFNTMKASVKKGVFMTVVSVLNVGDEDLSDVGLRITVPFSVEYGKASVTPSIKDGDTPQYATPNIYWPSFSLPRGKRRVFKLRGKVDSCQASGQFQVEAAVYINGADCVTTTSGPQASGHPLFKCHHARVAPASFFNY